MRNTIFTLATIAAFAFTGCNPDSLVGSQSDDIFVTTLTAQAVTTRTVVLQHHSVTPQSSRLRGFSVQSLRASRRGGVDGLKTNRFGRPSDSPENGKRLEDLKHITAGMQKKSTGTDRPKNYRSGK